MSAKTYLSIHLERSFTRNGVHYQAWTQAGAPRIGKQAATAQAALLNLFRSKGFFEEVASVLERPRRTGEHFQRLHAERENRP